jgi:hypothetical protein
MGKSGRLAQRLIVRQEAENSLSQRTYFGHKSFVGQQRTLVIDERFAKVILGLGHAFSAAKSAKLFAPYLNLQKDLALSLVDRVTEFRARRSNLL